MRAVRPASHGGHALHLTGTSELVRGRDASFLTALDDFRVLLPEETELVGDDSPRHRRSRLYLEALLRRTPPTDDGLYVGHRGALRPTEYQAQPAAKALRQPRPRILMADGVGLGKTIEVGILLSELIARGRGDRILVVVLKSLLAQFQKELWARFTIPLVRLDSVGIQRLRSKIPTGQNPFYFYDRAIVSIDTLKRDRKYRRWLEEARWDAIVIDECQNVADRSGTAAGSSASQRYRLARDLAKTTDALVLTSATPHDGRPDSFASLMNLLEPTAVADPERFDKDEVEQYFLRRFKKDVEHEVGEQFRERVDDLRLLDASPAEDAVFALLDTLTFKTVDRQRARSSSRGILFRTLLLKAFLSSPRACIDTCRERLAHKDLEDQNHPDAVHDREGLTQLVDLAEEVEGEAFTKERALLEHLRELGVADKGSTERVVVFAERIATLEHLREVLQRPRSKGGLGLKPAQVPVFHGALDDQRQRELIESFQTGDSEVRVLLASDAASEGVNLHYHCHRLVHFDLPWSLITLEQRNGRIDRFGQTEQPILTTLLTRPNDAKLRGDLRVLERLIEKEQVAHRQLGDASLLMQQYDEALESEQVGLAIEGEAEAEAVLPEPEEHRDFLAELLAGDAEPRPSFERPLRLFGDDLEYAREAFEQVLGGDASRAADEDRDLGHVQWHDEAAGFTLAPPPDLAGRFELLPRELRGQKQHRLTVDRDRVMQSLDDARRSSGAWPEWELFWELHPVSQWLDDRVLQSFARHEAPVVRVPKGLASGDAVFVFQAVLSNENGRPLVVEWFGVPFTGGERGVVRPLREWLDETGLTEGPPNPGAVSRKALDALAERRTDAVGAAYGHAERLRKQRNRALAGVLDRGLKDLERWRERRAARRDARRNKIAESGRGLTTFEQRRFDEEKRYEETLCANRRAWIQDEMTAAKGEFVRLAAVLVGVLGMSSSQPPRSR